MTGRPASDKRCPLCGGILREGKAAIPFITDGNVIVIKEVPAEICTDCGEPFMSGSVVDAVTDLLRELRSLNTEVSVVSYVPRSEVTP